MGGAIEMFTDYGRSQLASFTDRQNKQNAPHVSVVARSGFQAGSEARLECNEFSIGDAPSDEIFVFEGEGGQGSVQVTFGKLPMFVLATFRTQRPDVTVNDQPLGVSQKTVRLPCDVGVGGTELTIGQTYEEISVEAPFWRTDTMIALGIALISLAMVTALYFAPTPRPIADTAPPAPPRADFETTMTRIDTILKTHGMSGTVTVARGQDDMIQVGGAITSAQIAKWAAARQAIDTVTSDAALSFAIERKPSLTKLPPIALISRGDQPFVLMRDGRRVDIGQTLVDEWSLLGIERGLLRLGRGSETIAVSYEDRNDAD